MKSKASRRAWWNSLTKAQQEAYIYKKERKRKLKSVKKLPKDKHWYSPNGDKYTKHWINPNMYSVTRVKSS